jgi:DNA-binding response OmpR family regulator
LIDRIPRVLIAEDDDLIRNLLRAIIERKGCDVMVAADGAEALALLNRRLYDVLVLDLMMPIVNGYDVIAHLATMKKRPAVLVVTAMAGERFVDLDSEVVVAILPKPFDTELFGEVAAQLARAMAAARGTVAPSATEERRIEA